MIREIAAYHLPQPAPLFRQCLIHSDGYVYAWRGANTKFVLDSIVFDPREIA